MCSPTGLGLVDPDRAFLSAGGHSLAAARLIARLRGDLAVDLLMSAIVRDDPTLTQLVAAVTERLGRTRDRRRPDRTTTRPPPADAASASARSVSPPLVTAPLAPTMRRIWTWHRLHSDSPAYNVVRAGSAGWLRPAVLRAALADLTDRHEALRCAVTEPRPGEPEVVLADDVAVPLSVEVVRDGDGGWAADLDRALRRLADQPFAMDTRPCGGLELSAPAVRRSFLVLIMHHLIWTCAPPTWC